MTSERTPQIWFLTGSQGLSGEDVIAQVTEQSRGISDALASDERIVARVVAVPVLTSSAAIRRVMLDANSDDDCIGVIAWMHTFSPAKMWITGLDA
ncbi:MAG: L-arabinose isomerase, partial [Actinomycetota bacterium]|nr:L-arabinose isomerase [Actinomycetota bacterium]